MSEYSNRCFQKSTMSTLGQCQMLTAYNSSEIPCHGITYMLCKFKHSGWVTPNFLIRGMLCVHYISFGANEYEHTQVCSFSHRIKVVDVLVVLQLIKQILIHMNNNKHYRA